ncbi:MAG: tRNA lysidine(34) synthetase TilS [Pseudomonadota bacterium]|nr:tRNA lysidine(34) synthetase TilS [Pseudomonadota bacterium]
MQRAFDPASLQRELSALAVPGQWDVGFSGGPDSVALLAALVRCTLPPGTALRCVHVNHGLHPQAGRWARFCVQFCTRLGVPCRVVHVTAAASRGESPEAAARAARYGALGELLAPGGTLLTAHHRDDQAETLLLQALRGAGPDGLSAMPALARFYKGWHVRPLLGFDRAALERYARDEGLTWVDDPSNRETGYDRNYLRHIVMPLIRARWPAASRTLARAATLQAESVAMLEEVGRTDLSALEGPRAGTLSICGLLRLPRRRQSRVLRLWIAGHDLPPPTHGQMLRVLGDVIDASPDAAPRVRWPGAEVRRYRDALFAFPPMSAHDPGQSYLWDTRHPLEIPHLGRILSRESLTADGICLPEPGQPVHVGFRQGGERCRPAGRGHRHPLKKLFQEAGVPPWERDRIPLVYANGRLVGVVGFWACE